MTAARGRGLSAQIAALVRDIPDFPKPGVTFKDITPLLDDHAAFTAVVEALAAAGRDAGGDVVVDKVVGMEARGFILAAPVALALGVGFVPVRKPGKLPWQTRAVSYDLEYGAETLEMHLDALDAGGAGAGRRRRARHRRHGPGDRRAGRAGRRRVHGLAVLMELSFLPGRETVGDIPLTVLHTV